MIWDDYQIRQVNLQVERYFDPTGVTNTREWLTYCYLSISMDTIIYIWWEKFNCESLVDCIKVNKYWLMRLTSVVNKSYIIVVSDL